MKNIEKTMSNIGKSNENIEKVIKNIEKMNKFEKNENQWTNEWKSLNKQKKETYFEKTIEKWKGRETFGKSIWNTK